MFDGLLRFQPGTVVLFQTKIWIKNSDLRIGARGCFRKNDSSVLDVGLQGQKAEIGLH